MWVSWSMLWCNAAATAAAADDAFAVALPGSPLHWESLPSFVRSFHLSWSIVQHNGTGRDMHEWYSSVLHAYMLVIVLLLSEIVLACAPSHYCMHINVRFFFFQ